jgi:hypothetical protein
MSNLVLMTNMQCDQLNAHNHPMSKSKLFAKLESDPMSSWLCRKPKP